MAEVDSVRMLWESEYNRPEISELLLQCPEEKGIQKSEKSSSKENVDDHRVYAPNGGTLQDGKKNIVVLLGQKGKGTPSA